MSVLELRAPAARGVGLHTYTAAARIADVLLMVLATAVAWHFWRTDPAVEPVRGIGQAVAIGFAKQGSNVVINYHSDEDGARETLREAEAAGAKGIIVKADVGNEQEVKNSITCPSSNTACTITCGFNK